MGLKWTTYRLTLTVARLYGGVPKNPDIIKSWLEARGITDPHALADTQAAMTPQAATEKVWNGFKSDGQGLYIEARQVKAALKDAAQVVKGAVEVKALKSKLADRVFVAGVESPEAIYLGKHQPDGYIQRAIHVDTAMGPRDALKRADYVDSVTIQCTLKVLDDGVITELLLRDILEYAAVVGLGADRSQGGGRITEWLLMQETLS